MIKCSRCGINYIETVITYQNEEMITPIVYTDMCFICIENLNDCSQLRLESEEYLKDLLIYIGDSEYFHIMELSRAIKEELRDRKLNELLK